MNLPWDKSYFKLCFYVIFTFICIYIAKNAIDAVIYTFINLGDIYSFIANIIKKIFSVFSIIIAGFLIGYIIKPAVLFVEKKFKVSKNLALGIVFAGSILVIVAVVFIVCKNVDYNSFRRKYEVYFSNVKGIYNRIILFLDNGNLNFLKRIFNDIIESIYSKIGNLGNNLIGISSKILSRSVTVILSVVVAFYMLKDEDKIKEELNKYSEVFLKEKFKRWLMALIRDVDFVFSGYLRGQLTDGLIMASLISLGLAVIRVPFAVGIGLFSGFSNIIPYFGSIVGFLLSVGMALVSGEPIRAVYAGVLILVLQQIDSMVIVPKIVGDSVKLSPVMVIISLAVAGKLFGILGLVFAVPVVAVIKIRADRFCNSKKEVR